MSAKRLLSVNTQLVASEIFESEAAIINLGSGVYYTMDGAGAALWRLLEQGCSLQSISEALSKAYAVPVATIHADIEEVTRELLEEGLVVIDESGNGTERELSIEAPIGSPSYSKPKLIKYYDMMEVLALDPPLPLAGLEEGRFKGA
jgi:hypothetical protein